MQMLFFVLLIIFFVCFTILNYKKCKSLGEVIFLIIYLLVFGVPTIIFYMDVWNIPSLLNLVNGVDTKMWLENIFNYIGTISSTIIGSIVSIGLVLYEINKNNKETEKRDKENARLQNLPLLKYAINTNKNVEANLENFIMTNEEVNKTEKVYRFSLSIKNIGLNNIKRLKVKLESEIFSKHARNIFGYDSIEMLERDEEVIINKYFSLKEENVPYEMLITVFYEDVLSNWYKQTLKVEYIATNKFEVGGYIGEVKYLVNEEEIIDVKEVD